jgi:hypothetical protein
MLLVRIGCLGIEAQERYAQCWVPHHSATRRLVWHLNYPQDLDLRDRAAPKWRATLCHFANLSKKHRCHGMAAPHFCLIWNALRVPAAPKWHLFGTL